MIKKKRNNNNSQFSTINKQEENKMESTHWKQGIMVLLLFCFSFIGVTQLHGEISFWDDFEKGLKKWDLVNGDKIEIIDSNNSEHGQVLCLHSGGEAVYALIKNSQNWTNIKIEGDICFPWYTCSYLGLIYNYNVKGPRTDFGSIFILGPYGDDFEPYFTEYLSHVQWPPEKFTGNILLVNPHRDTNANRSLYSEYWVTLREKDTVKPSEWGHFKAEIIGPACHFYLGDMKIPKITYNYFEYNSGRVGFKPRFTGAEVWVDNVKVENLSEFSYKGPIQPAGIQYKPEKLLTKWKAIGPFSRRIKEIETEGYIAEKTYKFQGKKLKWEPFEADPRGCVVSARIIERFSLNINAYFYTQIESPDQREVTFEFSTTNPMVLWVNNTLIGPINKEFTAWYDFWENPGHRGMIRTHRVTLKQGKNQIIVLVKGGRYGGDGFYAYCNMEPEKETKSSKKIN